MAGVELRDSRDFSPGERIVTFDVTKQSTPCLQVAAEQLLLHHAGLGKAGRRP